MPCDVNFRIRTDLKVMPPPTTTHTTSLTGKTLLEWDEFGKQVPWGVLLLLGAGFSLAEAFEVSGLSLWIGLKLQFFRGVSVRACCPYCEWYRICGLCMCVCVWRGRVTA